MELSDLDWLGTLLMGFFAGRIVEGWPLGIE
jgi:hypothetical protein